MILWVYIFMLKYKYFNAMYYFLMDKKTLQNPQKFKPHEN